MRRILWILLLVATLAAALAWMLLARRGPGPLRLPAESCNAALWGHVYRPQRLKVIEPCTAVEGRVDALQQEGDGDLHILLHVDDRSLLNIYNVLHSHDDLVVEVVCHGTPAKGDAVAACAGFTSQVAVPKLGDRVRVTGSYVRDEGRWNEIHPVSRIDILP